MRPEKLLIVCAADVRSELFLNGAKLLSPLLHIFTQSGGIETTSFERDVFQGSHIPKL